MHGMKKGGLVNRLFDEIYCNFLSAAAVRQLLIIK
jgi:hypothetical protein